MEGESHPGLVFRIKQWLTLPCTCSGAVICVGGPALVYYVSPTEEDLFKKYNPDLQKKSLANRHEKQQEFDDFVSKLKEYSKSDKPSGFCLSYEWPILWPFQEKTFADAWL